MTTIATPRRAGVPLTARAVLVLVSIVVGLYAGLCAYFSVGQERFFFSPQKLPSNYTFQFPWAYQEIRLPVADGVTLDALLFKAKTARGVVFFVHGRDGNLQNSCATAGTYLAEGYDFFCFDYRGFGKSDGTIASEGQLHQDVAAAYTWILQRYEEQKVVVVGASLGTGPAAKLACANHPRRLILLAPYSSMVAVAHEWHPITRLLPAALSRYPLLTERFVQNCATEVTIVHGTADDKFPIHHAQRLLELLPPRRSRLIAIPGAGHRVSDNPAYPGVLRDILSASR